MADVKINKIRAQDRYAEEILEYLHETLERNEIGELMYQGSLHGLIRRVLPSAQAGDVVNILRESGAVSNVAHGLWDIRRRHVYIDADGNQIEFERPETYGHDSKYTALMRQIQELGSKYTDLERRLTNLTELFIKAFGTDPEEEGADVLGRLGMENDKSGSTEQDASLEADETEDAST